MSTYELEDELIRRWSAGDNDARNAIGVQLFEQLPPVEPKKWGAVAKDSNGEIWSRCDSDESCWRHLGTGPSAGSWRTWTDTDYGRMVEVLFEGVDL